MSNVIALQQFLVGKQFTIPPYQRDYAWTDTQIQALCEDISESIDSRTPHYLGTIVLSGRDPKFDVVDGQQRLTALTLIIDALLKQMPKSDPERIAKEQILVKNGHDLKLRCGHNYSFLTKLLSGRVPTPQNGSQKRLASAYQFGLERASALKIGGGLACVKEWLAAISGLEIIEFVAEDTGRAIRMFQTVNDRGLPLSTVDKAKSLLVLYSNRYLKGELDGFINDAFGRCHLSYDQVKDFVLSPAYPINYLASKNFTEDALLRFHYLSYWNENALECGDYDGSMETILDAFLRGTLKELAGQPSTLRDFIDHYVSDLRDFFEAFEKFVISAKSSPRVYRLLVILGLSARLYPLAVRLFQKNWLTKVLPNTCLDLLRCLEICDVRVYKTRATDPAKHIGDISHQSSGLGVTEISQRLKQFTEQFMGDDTFRLYLQQEMYSNAALAYILLCHDEEILRKHYTMEELTELVQKQITREHVFPQTPNFNVKTFGFRDSADYEEYIDKFGNITLATKAENARYADTTVTIKLGTPDYYSKSAYAGTRQLAQEFASNGRKFRKDDIIGRTDRLMSFALRRWPIW
jgi:hypothetical protein